MAKIVKRRTDSVSDILSDIQSSGLVTPEKLRSVKKSLENFQYKIEGHYKLVTDFKDFIEYLKLLLRTTIRSFKSSKGKLIENKIESLISSLYDAALQKFPKDVTLNLDYLRFCKSNPKTSMIAVQNMIRNCRDDPEMFVAVAKFYALEGKNFPEGLKIINKGLMIHKNNPKLYLEAVELLLLCPSNEAAQKQACDNLDTYVKFICDDRGDDTNTGLVIEILGLIISHSFTQSVQDRIIEWLLQNHPEVAQVWDILAQREMTRSNKTPEECLDLCVSKYQEGLRKVPQSERANLWRVYLECLGREQIRNKNSRQEMTKLPKILKSVLEEAEKENCLEVKHYFDWLELVEDDEALAVLERGTAVYPDSEELWKLRLRFAGLDQDKSRIDESFKKGVEALKDKSLNLWLMYVRYHSLLSHDNKVQETYEKGIKQPEEISQTLKPKYIEWLALFKNIKRARAAYRNIAEVPPYCKQLHAKMASLECCELDLDVNALSKVHELACQQFKKDYDVYINHIKFYIDFSKNDNIPLENVKKIKKDAESNLEGISRQNFDEKYRELKSSVQSSANF